MYTLCFLPKNARGSQANQWKFKKRYIHTLMRFCHHIYVYFIFFSMKTGSTEVVSCQYYSYTWFKIFHLFQPGSFLQFLLLLLLQNNIIIYIFLWCCSSRRRSNCALFLWSLTGFIQKEPPERHTYLRKWTGMIL